MLTRIEKLACIAGSPICISCVLIKWPLQATLKGPNMQVLYYTVITSVVEIARVIWDVSRFALVIAALHNLAGRPLLGKVSLHAMPFFAISRLPDAVATVLSKRPWKHQQVLDISGVLQ